MGDTAVTPPPSRNKPAGKMRRNVYWCFVIAALVAIIVYQAVGRPRPEIRSNVAFATPAYAQARVSVKAGERPVQAALNDLAAQSHVEIVTLWLPGTNASVNPETKVTLEDRTGTLQDLLDQLAAMTELAVDYEEKRIVAGNKELVHAATRATLVIYPVGDLLLIRDPLASGSSRQERLQSVTDLIEREVNQDDWRDNGGVLGSIANLDDKLYIMATPAMHLKIEALLKAVREK